MAMVVGHAAIITQKAYRIVLGNVLGIVLHKLPSAVPQGRYGLHIFVQAEHEAILLLILGHIEKRIVVDVAKQFDGGFDTPVEFVVEHKRLSIEEA